MMRRAGRGLEGCGGKRLGAVKANVRTITFDNGLEFTHHAAIAKGLGADIYFAHPYTPWELGCN